MPCGVFGSFGWSGEAVDELQFRLKDWIGSWDIQYFPKGFYLGPYIYINIFQRVLGANPEDLPRCVKGRD